MNRGRAILAFILIAIGLVWIGQGTAILPGSGPMTGQSFWAWVGGNVLIAGVAVFGFAVRRGLARPRA